MKRNYLLFNATVLRGVLFAQDTDDSSSHDDWDPGSLEDVDDIELTEEQITIIAYRQIGIGSEED